MKDIIAIVKRSRRSASTYLDAIQDQREKMPVVETGPQPWRWATKLNGVKKT